MHILQQGTVLKESADLVMLGVTFDAKMTFETHLRSVSSAASTGNQLRGLVL